jgi:hypothetical protein
MFQNNIKKFLYGWVLCFITVKVRIIWYFENVMAGETCLRTTSDVYIFCKLIKISQKYFENFKKKIMVAWILKNIL